MEAEAQIDVIVRALQNLADRLSMEGRILDAGDAVAGVQTIRALWTALRPPAPPVEEKPALAVVPDPPAEAVGAP